MLKVNRRFGEDTISIFGAEGKAIQETSVKVGLSDYMALQ
jgi:hypothetical protein